MQLTIPLSKGSDSLFRQIYFGLRGAILAGGLRSGERLPSTRDLAKQLGVSRTVVLLAYDQLFAEGFAAGRGGSGTYVAINLTGSLAGGVGGGAGAGASGGRAKGRQNSAKVKLSRYGAAAANAAAKVDFPGRRAVSLRYDFVYGGRSDIETFPFEMWRRILLRHARKAPIRELDYGAAAGSLALREAIAKNVRRSRAVMCNASQVIIVNGSQQALDLVARVLIERGDTVAIEDPQYQGIREILRAAGAKLAAVSVDRDGIETANLPRKARLAFVTPSHQFPTGAILPLARRLALLEWARRCDAVIVEDDYDGEFRYEGQPVESLQGLDGEGRVIYIGTFSRTMFSALRMGYLIAPARLIEAFTAAKWMSDRHTAMLEQETLAEFISTGMYERHLRRIRRRNAGLREALLEAVRKYLGDAVEVSGDGAGAHVVLWPRRKVAESEVIEEAAGEEWGSMGFRDIFWGRPRRRGWDLCWDTRA